VPLSEPIPPAEQSLAQIAAALERIAAALERASLGWPLPRDPDYREARHG
jgi:hypothetical protein